MPHHKTTRRITSASFSWLTRWMAIASVCLATQLIDVSESPAQSELAEERQGTTSPPVYLIEVPLPITEMVDTQIKRKIELLLSEQPPSKIRSILILEFSSQSDQASHHSEFERSLSLARFLASDRLDGTRTVAFVVGDLKGHALLPVLACEELIVDPDAEIGEAGVDESFIDRTMKNSYVEIAEGGLTIPVAIALGLIDQQATVLQVETDNGVRYILQEELEALKQSTNVSEFKTLFVEGDMARFTGRELRQEHHFASHLAADHGELAAALQIPISALQDDQSLDGTVDALRVDIARPISGKMVNWIIASINQKMANHQFNFVCLNIDSPGGSTTESLRLANFLISLSDSDVRTVAFVRNEARADAALIALACNEMTIGRDGVLGGPGAVYVRQDDLPDLRRSIRALCKSQHHDWSLPVALVDSSLVVHRYIRQGTNEVRYFCPEELATQDTPEEWKQEVEILASRGLSGTEAVEVQLAAQTADSFEEFSRLYALEGDIGVVQPNWANLLIERLASPHLAGTILFIGLMMFMIEMSQPGIGVAGFLSAVCFVLFFWSNALHGTAGWLEIMLFLTGVGCLVLEIFVIPGFGIFGIGGSAMVVGSIVLASQTFVVPQNKYQIEQLPQSLFVLVAAGSGAFVSMFILRKYFSELPILRHMLLSPTEDEDLEELQRREAVAHCEHLAGKRGTTTTRLNPAGKARFGDEVVDVIGEGDLIERGTDVSVASVQGSRIVVVPVSNPAEARPA